MNTKNRTKTVLTFAAVATAISLLAVTSASADLVDDIVEYWQLNDDYSAEVTATHEGTLTTTGTSSSTFVTGKFGQGIDLENSANNQAYVVIGGVEDDFDFAGESMSVSLWYTTESLYTSWQCLVAKGEGSSWRLHRNSNSDYGSTETDINFHTSINVTGYGALDQQDGSWHHVVATADAVNGGNLYVDGTLVDSVAGPIAIAGNSAAMQIGGNPGASGRGWDGTLDDVAVWNRALDATEVSDIWNGGAGVSIGILTGITDPNLPSVDAGDDMITWSGQEVQLTPTVVNNDSEVPQRTLSYLWSAEPVDGIVFSATDIEAPTVTITKATLNPSPVMLRLAVTLSGVGTMPNTMTIDVYDDSCEAAKGTAVELDSTDIDADCITGLADFALLAKTWFEEYSLTEPIPKPGPGDLDFTPPTPDPMTFAAVPTPGGGSVQVVESYGFEVPDQGDSGHTYNPTGSVWTFTGGSGLAGPSSPWRCNSTSPDPLGDQFAFLQVSAAISKDLTGLVIGETYKLSFLEAYRTSMSPSNDLSVILDEGLGAEVVIYNNPGVTNTTWEPQSTNPFVAAKTSYTLTFSTTNPLGGDRSTIIDGVEVLVLGDLDTSITMIATTASDPFGTEYYFDEISGNPGGDDSGWQDSKWYVDTGLTSATTYTYTVKARDKSPNLNETAASGAESATTN